jgi:hypothetical protein
MRYIRTLPALTLCTLAWTTPAIASTFSTTVSGFVDDADGTSLDLDVYWEPTRWLALGAGVGSADSSSDLADLSGESVRASIDVHGAAFGGRLGWRNWQDAGDFESDSVSAEIYWRGESWQLGLIGEQRDFSIDYTITVAARPISRSVDFEGQGFGAQASWYGERWGGYLRAVGYDYDSTLDRVIAAAQLPNLSRFPRIEALVGSVLTRTAGAIDHDLAAGIERSFQRSALRLDLSATRDAVSAADSRSASLGYRYSVTSRFDVEATVGVVDSDDLDSVGFAGLALTFRN